jgi:hypothetical protein
MLLPDRGEHLVVRRRLELPFDVRLEHVRKLAVVANEDDAARRQAQRDHQVERVRARGLVDDYRVEQDVVARDLLGHRL